MTTLPATTSTPKPTIAHRLIRATGPIMSPFAGRRFFPLWAILEHRGRKSGRLYRIPVVARRTPEGFVIPMPFGEGTDWVRNVLAAGTCAIVWKGRRFEADQAETIGNDEAAPAFNRWQRKMFPVIGIARFVRVRAPQPE
jgi:deazaflavin-dependent oxidoreductase (nitroreductase family)